MTATRAQIVTTAREWLGTPYKHQASLKGVGCDCVGLIKGLSHELKLTEYDTLGASDQKYNNYSQMPDSAFMREALGRWLTPIRIQDVQDGDVLFLAWVKDPQHLALKTDIGILHSYLQARKVVEHALDAAWAAKIIAAYRFPFVQEDA